MSNQLNEWVVYILCCADGTLYTGSTNQIDGRVKKHNSGQGAKYTRSRLPVKLVFVEKQDNKSSALKREIAIKRLSRQQKQNLISTENNVPS